ncbi:MAG: hypothetical protein RIN55_07820 [Tissierellaceae bacterium]|nr:hypothetical protein [Tissierellaceae bacterium]
MGFNVEGQYSAFEELMHYYHYEFNVFYLLTLIVLVNCIKSIIHFTIAKQDKIKCNKFGLIDIGVSVLAGLGLMSGLFFQGILSDVSFKYAEIYLGKMMFLCIVSFILFIVQLFFSIRGRQIIDNKAE